MIPGMDIPSDNTTPAVNPPLAKNEGSQARKWLLLEISNRIAKFPDQFNAR